MAAKNASGIGAEVARPVHRGGRHGQAPRGRRRGGHRPYPDQHEPIVYEVLGFACEVTDHDGRVLAQTNALTLFTANFGTQVLGVVDKF